MDILRPNLEVLPSKLQFDFTRKEVLLPKLKVLPTRAEVLLPNLKALPLILEVLPRQDGGSPSHVAGSTSPGDKFYLPSRRFYLLI